MKSILKYPLGFLMFLSFTVFANPVVKETQPITSNFLLMVVILVIGLIIGALSIYLYSKSKIYSILSNERFNYLDSMKEKPKFLFKYIAIVKELKESKDKKKRDKEGLIKKNDELNKEMNKLKSYFEKSEDIFENKKDSLSNNQQDTITKAIDLKIEPLKSSGSEIYFEIPEEDGTFNTQDGKIKQNIYCFYKIVTEDDPLKGKIYFISGSLDLRALGNIDNYLNPVCEIANIANRIQAKRIEMSNPGTVFLNGDSWKIDVNNKVKLRLI